MKEESEKAGLKLNIQKTKIMASGPITSCQIDGETVATKEGWRNSSRKEEETEPKQKQEPIVDTTGDRSKVWCCKEQ